jgi:hypothetical protein
MPYRDGLYLTVVFLLINLTSITGITAKSVSKSIKPASRVVSTRKASPINPALPKATVDYPYQSAAFKRFVAESFRNQGTQDASMFYQWMEQAYAASPYRDPNKKTFTQLLNSRQQMLNRVTNLSKRVDQEVALSAWSHRFVKQIIPRFSLERGFEFYNTVNRGERQCFLQSVLIAGMLQQMGVNAGVVMVNKNLTGAETNNGHAVTLVKLSNGQDIIVDASDKTPFVDHKGLFVRAAARYLYVNPVYQADSPIIAYYRDEATRQKWVPS